LYRSQPRAEQRSPHRRPLERRTLEWSHRVEAPAWNFAVHARLVRGTHYWNRKQRSHAATRSAGPGGEYQTSRCRNAAAIGLIHASLPSSPAVALDLHIWWMSRSGYCAFETLLAFAFRSEEGSRSRPSGLTQFERRHQAEVAHEVAAASRRFVKRRCRDAAKPVRQRKRIVAAFGWWIFLLSDRVMFSAMFAATRCC